MHTDWSLGKGFARGLYYTSRQNGLLPYPRGLVDQLGTEQSTLLETQPSKHAAKGVFMALLFSPAATVMTVAPDVTAVL